MPFGSQLITELHMHVAQSSQVIFLKVPRNMILNFITCQRSFVIKFCILARLPYLVWGQMLQNVFVPHCQVNISVQVSSRHFVLLWPLSSSWKNNHIDEIFEVIPYFISLLCIESGVIFTDSL